MRPLAGSRMTSAGTVRPFAVEASSMKMRLPSFPAAAPSAPMSQRMSWSSKRAVEWTIPRRLVAEGSTPFSDGTITRLGAAGRVWRKSSKTATVPSTRAA